MGSFVQSRESPKKYFDWRVTRSRPIIRILGNHAKLKNSEVLEIGCGYGALTSLLLKKGANVTSTEIDQKSLALARKFIGKNKKLKLVKTNNEKLPFLSNSFDLVILFDVIEHVEKPEIMLNEVIRVLKHGGILYLEFTPYYSLVGHHLYDYTKFPVHLLPFGKKYIKKLIFNNKNNYFFTPKEVWDQFNTLNKIKISSVQNYISGLQTIDERYIIKYPDVFELNLPFIKFMGNIKDYFCFGFEGFYKKI